MSIDSVSRANPGPKVAAFHAEGRGVMRIGYPILITRGTVLRRELVTPHMLRLTVGGPEFAGFHSYQADDHVKIAVLTGSLPDSGARVARPVRR